MTQTSTPIVADPASASLPQGSRSEGGTTALPVVVPPPGAWLESDIALLKSLRAETLDLARRAANYDTRLQRLLTDVEAEIRKSLSALLLMREDGVK